MKRFLIGVALAASACAVNAQAWNDTGNPAVIPGTNFLGSTNDAAMDVKTFDIRRFTLLSDATYTIGSFPAQVKNGSLLLSPDVDQFYFNGAPGPLSLLHLAAPDDNAQTGSFRDWMNIGMTLTGNADHCYIGQKADGLDSTDLVLHWSDNPGKELKDRMRFLFTSGYNSSATTYAQDFGFRPWMRNGVTMTGNSDQMYIGHKYTYVDSTDYESGEINDRSDAVIEWRLDGLIRPRSKV